MEKMIRKKKKKASGVLIRAAVFCLRWGGSRFCFNLTHLTELIGGGTRDSKDPEALAQALANHITPQSGTFKAADGL